MTGGAQARGSDEVAGERPDGTGAEGRGEDEGRGMDELDRSLHSDELPERVTCPFCQGEETEQFASFGSAVSTSQYYCRRCRTVFEFMKRRGHREDVAADRDSGGQDPEA